MEENTTNSNEQQEEQVNQPQPEEKTPEEKTSESKPTTEAEATEMLQSKGFDYKKLQEEYNSNGDITKETRKELVEAGIEEAFIDDYINGRKAEAKQKQEEFLDIIAKDVGGREELKKIYAWATNHLSKDELDGINSITGLAGCKFVVNSLKTRMQEAEGVIPSYLSGEATKETNNVFESRFQMMEAIKDPRYDNDPSYRERVGKKIKESKKLGYI